MYLHPTCVPVVTVSVWVEPGCSATTEILEPLVPLSGYTSRPSYASYRILEPVTQKNNMLVTLRGGRDSGTYHMIQALVILRGKRDSGTCHTTQMLVTLRGGGNHVLYQHSTFLDPMYSGPPILESFIFRTTFII